MNICFFYEYGKINEIGMGHKYRCERLGWLLKNKGHNVCYVNDYNVPEGTDLLVVDHMFSQIDLIKKVKGLGIVVLLIDGAEEDVEYVDISVSAFVNKKSQYIGIEYLVFPVSYTGFYKKEIKSNKVFVGCGGFDQNNMVDVIIPILKEYGMKPLVAESINHDLRKYDGIDVYRGDDYFDVFDECVFGITNGGLTMFQALYYGLPIIAIPQNEHQDKDNIANMEHCCVRSSLDWAELSEKVKYMC